MVRIARGEDLVLELGNLDARRGWGYAGEYVGAIWRMLQRAQADDYVIASGEAHSVREFVEELSKLSTFKSPGQVLMK